MGFAVYGDAANAESSAADDSEEVGNDDESVVHQTASVGDAEVHDYSSQFFCCQGPFHYVHVKEPFQSNHRMKTHL